MAGLSGDILITGGAGFLGRGILRHIEAAKIKSRVTVYSRDEHKQYALRGRFPWVRTVLGDICDTERLAAVAAGHDTIIHAAALKHVPEAERDVAEAIRINVIGSRSVAQAAVSANVGRVVAISTDKVCSPRNTYGATKMLMERAFQEAQRLAPRTHFSTVRYGNVVSSTGSVVPLFIDQINKAGFVTLTDPAMTRFWFPIDDAVSLINYALSDHRRGHTYVAFCPAASIEVVAQAAWQLAGKDGSVQYKVIGTRPGEKLHETLIDSYEAPFVYSEEGLHGEPLAVIPPATALAGSGDNAPIGYTSAYPHEWVSVESFITMIEDARLV